MTSKERAKDARLRREFHITLEEFKKVLEYQQGACFICKKKYNKKGKPLQLAVDHDHKTGELRGLLCWPCNKGIGIFLDNLERLQNAVIYFQATPVSKALGIHRYTAPGEIGTKVRKKLLRNFNAARKGDVKTKKK